MLNKQFYIVDVFAEQAYAGNQLAVVVSDTFLADTTMQQIACEMNFSETTFVTRSPEVKGGYRVRVFTPAREVEFTGHPILGTAWVLRRHVISEDCAQVQLNLNVGEVPVNFEINSEGKEIAWFRAPNLTLGAICDPRALASAIGLSVQDLDTTSPIQVISAGTSAIIAPLRNLESLQRARLNLDVFAPLAKDGYPPLVYLFCRETRHPQNDFCVRFFFEAHGVREDPATGNGAAFFGAYLLAHSLHQQTDKTLTIEQGYEMSRPSLIHLRAQLKNGAQDIRVGGGVFPSMQGELL